MALRLTVRPNELNRDGGSFAKVVFPARVDFESLLDDMVKDTALSRNDMRVVMQQFRNALCFRLKMGFRVETPVGSFNPGVSGGVVHDDALHARVDRERLRVNFVPDRALMKEYRSGAMIRMEPFSGYTQPHIHYVGTASDTQASDTDRVCLPAGALCKLVGSRLRFDKTNPDLGLFLVPTPVSPATVRVTNYSRNGSRFIDFLIPPDTPAGTYRLELRTRTPSGSPRHAVYGTLVCVG